MNLLVTGKGTSGSWAVRGEQLGNALGATVKPNATARDMKRIDLAIVVKRTPETVIQSIRSAGIPWVYDIMDAYKQPQSSQWTRDQAIGWAKGLIEGLKPSAVIWPNQRMREDCDTGLPGMVLRHHHRPGIASNPIREKVTCIGYEGSAAYLERWRPLIDAECVRRGWRFEVNPKSLTDLDIVLAVRGGQWEGYVPRHWKSNVKLANAHGSGTPFVGQQECGYLETASGAEYWAEDRASLAMSLDWLESRSTREQVSDRFRQCAYPVEKAAEDLKAFLHGL